MILVAIPTEGHKGLPRRLKVCIQSASPMKLVQIKLSLYPLTVVVAEVCNRSKIYFGILMAIHDN